jgi:hypothetical protein
MGEGARRRVVRQIKRNPAAVGAPEHQQQKPEGRKPGQGRHRQRIGDHRHGHE